jgi:ubiquinone/menaquinone biosynthesis C-methylase UbiE
MKRLKFANLPRFPLWLQKKTLNVLKNAGYSSGIFPHMYQLYSAIKAYELETLLRYLNLPEGATIVDICCGTGLQTQLLAQFASRVVGIDIDQKKIRDARWHLRNSKYQGRVCFSVGQAENIPLPGRIADAVVCLCSVEHLSDPLIAVREIVRILKPGGKLYMTADSLANVTDSQLKLRHQSMYKVYCYYDITTLEHLLTEGGLQVKHVFSILRSEEAIEELKRSMDESRRGVALTMRSALKQLRRSESCCPNTSGGLFVFAVATKPKEPDSDLE